MFARRVISFCLTLLSALPLCAQHNPYEYYLGGTSSQYLEGSRNDPDLTLFYAPLEGGADVFTDLSEYNFSAVRYARRGYDMSLRKVYLGNLEISGALSQYPDYSLLSIVRRSRLPRSLSGAVAATGGNVGSANGMESFTINPAAISQGYRFGVFTYNRNGRIGFNVSGADRIASSKSPHKELSFGYNVSLRNGEDANIKGVFTEELSLSLVPRYSFNGRSALTAGLFVGSSKRGLRSSATKEALELAGDNYYNPSWGYFAGDVRNSRVRDEKPLLAIVTYEGSYGKANGELSFSYSKNKKAYSSLSWFDAATPYPDYYRDMPSYLGDTPAGDYIREQWRAGNPSVRQIDWARLCETNKYAGQIPVEDGGARYLIEDRVEDNEMIQFAASGKSSLGDYSSLSYGIRVRRDVVHYYKEAKDLLGGQPFLNADQYLADTTRYGGRWLNDLRNPDKVVGEGDVFGYNYRVIMVQIPLFGAYDYMSDRFRFNAAVEISPIVLHREGLFEKQLHPGGASYGASERIKFSAYTAKASAGYSFSPKHIVRFSAMAGESAPVAGNIFVSPEYSNTIIDKPRTVSVAAAEVEYAMTLNPFMCKVAGFYTGTSNETAVYSYYDDIEAVYSDMVLSDISKRFYGVELGARYDFSPRLALSVAASIGDYTYAKDPSVNIYEDATLDGYVVNSKSYLEGYRIGNTPQKAVSAELKYNMFGFIASLTVNYMADRYVVANPLRRMERAYNLAESPERFDEFVAQEELPAATTVDLFIMKSSDLKRGTITLLLSVNNLLDNKEIIYSGYEQMRIMRRGTGINRGYVPFDPKYLYSYPRSFYLSATYRF